MKKIIGNKPLKKKEGGASGMVLRPELAVIKWLDSTATTSGISSFTTSSSYLPIKSLKPSVLQYETFKIHNRSLGTFYPFAFTDIMGLEKDTGVMVEDIILAMNGHVKDGYTFNPQSSLSEHDHKYNKEPTLNDKVHVLVSVIDANKIKLMSDDIIKQMRTVRLAASDMGIPQMAILTKIDEACPEVKKNIRNVYKSTSLKEQIVSVKSGIPLYCIFPVKNYHSEIQTDDDIDTLILAALKQMINFGEDYVNK
uniref:Interferon-induced protein 44-like n=1 Tax=Haplochromis burtoni TaxID=8153 RepID=A0A3Q2X3A7_HAPBU